MGEDIKLSIKNIGVSYSKNGRITEALRSVSLTVKVREFVSVVGPSGCGKSTLLKVICGLIKPTLGQIYIDGKEVTGVPDKVGFVFQNDALLPWMSVMDNVRLPLDIKGVPKKEQKETAKRLICSVGLNGFEDYMISQLSGGMKKRVTLARTFAYDPGLYLMDEPFGPLDAQTRVRIGEEFLALWEKFGKSVIFVTHDIEEAIALSDRVIVLTNRPGTIKDEFVVELGRPRPFYMSRFEPRFKVLQREIWGSLSSMEEYNL
ncbi:MAG: ABC transporter ATP-binding protein [Synergistaceae bacterium]|nr:ABC transporter ATP-binding protein [Synergistaceae bacterium]